MEVFLEPSLTDPFGQIAVARGNDPAPGLAQGTSAHPHILPPLQKPEQFPLPSQRKFGHFVEKEAPLPASPSLAAGFRGRETCCLSGRPVHDHGFEIENGYRLF